MRVADKLKLSLLIVALAIPSLSSQVVLAGEEQRAPPTARTSGTLGPQVCVRLVQFRNL